MFLYAESVVVKGGLRWRLMFGLKNVHIGTTNKLLLFTMSLIGNRLFYRKKRKGMNEIPTEKFLPQGLQDMLSVHRKYTAQANDINNEIINREMKISDITLKRYTASKGKSLKWYEWVINPNTRESERVLRYAECTAVIDTNQLDGEVMEIQYQEYKEWWDNNYHCLGVTGL